MNVEMDQIMESLQVPSSGIAESLMTEGAPSIEASYSPSPPLSENSSPRASRVTDDPDHPVRTFRCAHCGHLLQVKMSCGKRTCPVCRRKWFGYHYGALKKYVSTWSQVYFLTLTLKNIPDGQMTRWHIKRLREAFSKLRYRFKGAIQDGFYIIQATNCGEGWHLHVHVLYRGKYVSKAAISEAWREITKGSYIVDIKRVERFQKALQYLLSDFSGKPRVREQDVETYNRVFHGCRLVQGFGEYSKIKLRVPFRCPVCGDCSWVLIDCLLGEAARIRPEFYGEPPP